MEEKAVLSILSDWLNELNYTLSKRNSICISLFSVDGKLLFSNETMSLLFKGEPNKSFINPTFDNLLSLDNSVSLIFEGFLTLGDYLSINTSIWAQVYRKENKLLVLGGVNAAQLLEQNETMHQLNREISNLQRQLIREKHALENTLNQLNEANSELKKLNTEKDRFISILAHDLKSPFNGILGFLELLLENIRKYDINRIESQIKIVHDSARQTFFLLEDILSWEIVQSGKLFYVPQKLSCENIFREVVESLKYNAFAKKISVSHSVKEEISILADKDMVKTILRNLISNAIKFTPNNGWIKIYAEQDQVNATITVSDNGKGIDPKVLLNLFDASQNYTTNGTEGEKGTGLGLLLCKEFVEKQGGTIWVESVLGKGTDFKFTILLYKS